ncbi:hypothetical protein LOTGIDRAFT_154962 [Lottia gigantea]|uniref:Uncharacterized protein n=1 Tax=Lottia gigantea TaxID=225164 RepID=V3ZSE3_LOTGI|nr:hypothetical protein LOTGIDRAFT_154962 [Lottia gigantea]ESO85470.1 hypothetical protein LOTGIDRAFT_154962 [Lottia gigantea]
MADHYGHPKRFKRRFPLPAVISAVYDTNNGSHKSRKRKADPNTWQKNIRCLEYNTGARKQVNGVSGSRRVGSGCKDTCKLSCTKKFTDEERQGIFDSYWGTNNHQRRRDFTVSHTKIFKKTGSMTGGTPSRRSNTIHYFLPQGRDNIHVCKVYFLNTLDISDSTVKYNVNNSNNGLVIFAEPKVPVNKTSDTKKQCVINHINSFPKVDSHYCRATTKKKYLDPSLNIKAMYRLYSVKCKEEGSLMVTESMYRYIFNTEFNLGFHTPGKDVCDTCTKYKMKKEANTLTEVDDKNQEEHLKRKQQARNSKEKDKTRDGGSITAVFDLQQVMTVPKLNISSADYLRNLNVYNLTVLEFQSHQGHCYTWNETEGKRGTNEIASAITIWLAAKDAEGFEHVILYSDSCKVLSM